MKCANHLADFAREATYSTSNVLGALAVMTVLFGCGDLLPEEMQEGQDLATDEFAFDAEEGTCDGWKVRYCEAFVQCGHGTLEECVFDAEYVDCHPDSAFAECEQRLQRVIDEEDCSLFPNDCYPRDIADRNAANRLCMDVQEAACEFDFFCGTNLSVETCVAETSHLYACSERLSVVPGGDQCVTELNRAACGDALPEVCMDHTR